MSVQIVTVYQSTIILGCAQIVIIRIPGLAPLTIIVLQHPVETAILNQLVIIRGPVNPVIRLHPIGVRPLITQLQASPAVPVIHHRKVTGRVSVRIVMSLHPGLR